MLICRVAVEELVLNKAVQRAKFGNVAAQHSKIVHETKNPAHLALAGENGEKCLTRGDGVLEGAIDQVQAAADKVNKLGMELQLANLGVMESPHEAIRIVIKNLARLGFELAILNDEAVELFGFLTNAKKTENALGAHIGSGLHFTERRLAHQIDRARVAVVVAHEGLDLAEDIFLWVVEFISHAPLELERENIGRASVQVLHGGASSQHEVVTFFKPTAISVSKDAGLDDLCRGVESQLEL